MKRVNRILILLTVISLTGILSAQEKGILSAPPKPQNRPSVALVLAGGGARGFAHLPVLELLEKEGIPIDIVIGTSAGSIVGSLYCAGYTPEQIKQKLAYLDWSSMFQDTANSPFESTLGDHSTYSSPFAIRVGADKNNIELQMGTGVLTGQHAYELFKKLTLRLPSDMNFNDLPIPFRAVATNLLTGDITVFAKGDVAEAVRASMSIPGVFQPFNIDGTYYIDGMARDNTPIDVAHEMGYDIIIVSEISDTLEENYKKFESNPLVAVQQMINMEQAVKNRVNYRLADLVIFPDYGGHSVIDYQSAPEIYAASKATINRYTLQLAQIKKRIDEASKYITESDKRKPKHNAAYDKNPEPVPETLTIHGADSQDIAYIKKSFAKIAGMKFTPELFEQFSQGIYRTGKYKRVVTRLDSTNSKDGRKMELLLTPNEKQNGLVMFGGTYKASRAADSQSSLTLATDIQWRGLTGTGSVLSLRATCIDNFDTQLLLMQPIGSHSFSQLTCTYKNDLTTVGSGWIHYPVETDRLRQGLAQLKFGFPLSQHNTLLAGGGINWYDTSETITEGDSGFAGDFNCEYLFNTLNHMIFPTSGIYVELNGTGVLPIDGNYKAPIVDIEQIDAIGAIPLGNKFCLVLNGCAGFNSSQTLRDIPELMPIYGFSLADSRFFPQIPDASYYGIHKMAVGASLQFFPWNELTLLGGQAFFAVSGSVGNIWDSYSEIGLENLQWRSSFDFGIRITDGIGLILRTGAGTTRGYVLPFVSFELGSIRG